MKNIHFKLTKKIKQIFSIAILATAVFAVSCEIPEDPASILELRISTNIFTHKAFIQMRDLQNQGNLAGNVLTAKVTVDGPNQDILVSEAGEIKDTYTLRDGIGAFAVNPKYRGFTEPISIKLEITGTNYLTKNLSLLITPQDSTTIINETILNTQNVPQGVAVVQQSAPLTTNPTTGAVSNPTPVTVATNASTTNTSAEVTVPAGNTFSDASGNPITSGNLEAQVVYFDGSSDDASSSSNNSSVSSLVDENGATLTNVEIAPVATADINMTVGSTEVKQFGTPIDITLDINSGFINPDTGNAVQAGEEFNIYSTSNNGNWEYQGKGTVVNNNGKLQVTFPTDHLSTFSLGTVVNKCTTGVTYIPLPEGNFGTQFEAQFKKPNGANIGAKRTVSTTQRDGVTVVVLNNVPSEQATLTLTSTLNSSLSTTTGVLNWCSGVDPNAINVSDLEIAGTTSVYFKVSARCSETQTITPAGVLLYIEYESGSNNFQKVGTFNPQGAITIPNIDLTRTYRVRVYYDGESGDGEYNFGEAVFNEDTDRTELIIDDYELPGDVCSQL